MDRMFPPLKKFGGLDADQGVEVLSTLSPTFPYKDPPGVAVRDRGGASAICGPKFALWTSYGYGERKMVFDDLGLLDVVPVQIHKSNDVQDAYAITIYDYMPIAEANGRFPLFQGQFHDGWTPQLPRARFKPSVSTTLRLFVMEIRAELSATSTPRSVIHLCATCGSTPPVTSFRWAIWELRGFTRFPMSVQDILGGYRNGQPYMRPAMVEDCRVYPNLRLIITSMGLDRPMYDGPAFDWDPKIPIIQFTVDDWAWEPLGRSLVGDVASIETTKRKIERKVDNVVTVTLNPPMGYDMTQTGGPKVEHFDIFEQDVRIGVDGKPKDTLQSVLPDEVRVDAVHFQFLKYLKDAEQEQLGLSDLRQSSEHEDEYCERDGRQDA